MTQALVLVGGEGTRLRPLTLTQPKPAIPLVDRPFIRYMVDWLGRHGVTEVLMACGFRAEDLREALGDEVPGGPSITYLQEGEPLGTAGPLRLAADQGLLEDRFFALNGDVLTDLDLTALRRQHEQTGAVVTLALYPVDDPSSYGLVRRAEDGEVLEFVEKPDTQQIDTGEISAGAYVVDSSILELIPAGRAVSIEREVFPQLVGRGLYGCRLEGYWMDIGTPERYLQASWDILEGRVQSDVQPTAPGLWIDERARIADGAGVGPRAVVHAGCEVGDGAVVSGSGVLEACRIEAEAEVREAILGAGVTVAERAKVGPGTVIGAGARVESGAKLEDGARVSPEEVVA